MYTKILIPLDGSEFAESVIPYVKWFIKVSDVDEIVLLRAVEPLQSAGGIALREAPEERKHIDQDSADLARKYLGEIARQYQDAGIKVTIEVLIGKPVKVIAEFVAECDVDLIIMASHGLSGIHRWVRGSIADEIFHAAKVPIFLVKPEDRPPEE